MELGLTHDDEWIICNIEPALTSVPLAYLAYSEHGQSFAFRAMPSAGWTNLPQRPLGAWVHAAVGGIEDYWMVCSLPCFPMKCPVAHSRHSSALHFLAVKHSSQVPVPCSTAARARRRKICFSAQMHVPPWQMPPRAPAKPIAPGALS